MLTAATAVVGVSRASPRARPPAHVPRCYSRALACALGDYDALRLLNSGAALAVRAQLLTTGAIRLNNNVAATNADSPTGVLSINTWYRFELDYLLSATVGTSRCACSGGQPHATLHAPEPGAAEHGTTCLQPGSVRTPPAIAFAYDWG
jgi:hypothetical protein